MRRLFRSKNVKIGHELDFALVVPRRVVEVDDQLVSCSVGVERKTDLPDQLLVCADIAERFAVEHIRARHQFNSLDARLKSRCAG